MRDEDLNPYGLIPEVAEAPWGCGGYGVPGFCFFFAGGVGGIFQGLGFRDPST